MTFIRRHVLSVAFTLSFAGIIALAILRAGQAQRTFGLYTGCESCFWLPAIASDMVYFSAALLIAALLLLPARGSAVVGVSVFWLACLLHAADLAVTSGFGLRLYVTDIPKFADFGQLASVLGDFWTAAQGSAVMLVVGVLVGVLVMGQQMVCLPERQRRRIGLCSACGALVVLSMSSWWPSLNYVHPDATRNVFAVNLQFGSNIRYSQAYQDALGQGVAPSWEQVTPRTPKNLIVLVAESLSAYHSSLYGARVSAVPRLDDLVRQHGAYVPDFWANGFTTDAGLISVFASELPLPTPGRYHSVEVYQGFGERAQPLYLALSQQGYRLGFLNGADLGFLGMGDFFERLGFQEREDSNSPAFRQGEFGNAPRGQFGAVADEILLRRSLAWIDQQTQPYLLGLLTISTHPPFLAPGRSEPNERDAFAYLDRVLTDWFGELQSRRFFDDGVLVVVGDHRSMTPIGADEFRQHGRRAAARVPMMIFGAGLHGAIDGEFQQVDILPSIAALTGFSADPGLFHGRVFPSPRPAQVRVHVTGAERDRVLLEHRGALFHYRMAGDRSTIEPIEFSGDRRDVDLQPWLIELNRQRFSRGELPHNYVDWLMRPG